MITSKLTMLDCINGFIKMVQVKALGYPFSVNLEVTKRCNARCKFCDYWKTEKEELLDDYSPIIKRLRPIHVTITGGEPLLRKDLPDIIKKIKDECGFVYTSMITNASLLTPDKALKLWDAGLSQIGISLDYLGSKHDKSRGIPGLYRHISELIPEMRAKGIDNISLQTIIMEDNLEELIDIARKAREWNVKVSYSSYGIIKTNNRQLQINKNNRLNLLKEIIDEIIVLKKSLRNIITSDYYLKNVPVFFENGSIDGCTAGINWIQVTPDGYLKQCPELPANYFWKDFSPKLFNSTDCTKCWYSCRGEAQVPMNLKRIVELNTLQ